MIITQYNVRDNISKYVPFCHLLYIPGNILNKINRRAFHGILNKLKPRVSAHRLLLHNNISFLQKFIDELHWVPHYVNIKLYVD